MMSASEKATHKSIICPRLSVHHESVSWALCYEFVRSTIHLPVAATGAGLPFCEISGIRPRPPGFSTVACESKPRSRRMLTPLWEQTQRRGGVQRLRHDSAPAA